MDGFNNGSFNDSPKVTVKKGSFAKGLVCGILASAVVLGSIFTVLTLRLKTDLDNSYTEPVQIADIEDGLVVNKDFAYKTEEINKLIEQVFYFQDNIDPYAMREKMYAAVLDSLDDPYSTYYTVEEWEEETQDSSGTYYGIGSYVRIDEETQYPILSGVFEGSPASAAGLRDGDIIYEVNGENVGGMTLTDVVALIRGPEGTDVTLTIIRGKENLTITVTRGKVNTISCEYSIQRDNIGYIQLKEFSEVAEGQFKDCLSALKKAKVDGIIIDLRGNGGGNLSTVLGICEELLPKGLITYLEYVDGSRDEYKSSGKHEIDIPMVVLVNGYSASASELMTGALRDHKKATIIGTTTFGKGIAQSLYPFTDGTAVKLTTASYFTPNGECVHGTGITPDIVVEFDSEKYYDAENPVDNQLEYAIDYLLNH